MPAQLNNFLDRINYHNVHLLPYNNNAQILAAQIRNLEIQVLGKDLMKRNVEREARRLRLYNRDIIDLATDQIWNSRSTSSQKNRFIKLANDANDINKQIDFIIDDTIKRIDRIPPQITNNNFERDFFNGAIFRDNDKNNSFDSLIFGL